MPVAQALRREVRMPNNISAGDTAWLLASAALVMLMTPALGFFYGWLGQLGALDFAGGTVVHITSGVSALVAALVLGRRVGYGRDALEPHDATMTVLGASLLWFGWFGFNAGSAITAGGLAANAFVVTNTAAAMAALTWMTVSWLHKGA